MLIVKTEKSFNMPPFPPCDMTSAICPPPPPPPNGAILTPLLVCAQTVPSPPWWKDNINPVGERDAVCEQTTPLRVTGTIEIAQPLLNLLRLTIVQGVSEKSRQF
jgi:hypothetical protein